MRAMLIGGAALLALAACSKPAEEGASAAADAGTSASTSAVDPLTGQTPPKRKPGLWTISMKGAGAPPGMASFRTCIDETTDADIGDWGREAQAQSQENCRDKKTARTADGWVYSAVCDMPGGGTTRTEAKATGDFSSRYKVEVKSVTEGSPTAAMNGERTITLDSTWAGACPADWKPGDVEIAGGMRINPNTVAQQAGDMAKMMQNLPPEARERMAREMAERMGVTPPE